MRYQMTANTSNPDKRNLQPLKKRKVEIKDETKDHRNNETHSFQGTNKSTKHIKEENTGMVVQNIDTKDTFLETDNSDEHSEATSSQYSQTADLLPKIENTKVDTNIVKNENGNDNEKLVNNTQHSLITIRKVEDLQPTPKKNVGSNELVDAGNIKTENTNSPRIFNSPTLRTDSMEWHSRTITSLSEAPTPNRGKRYFDEDSTPLLRKRRKTCNDIGDCDRLSDVLKSELYDTGLNDMEPIAMLHDLDSVIDFEDTKITTEFLSSTAMNLGQDDHNIELSKDPQTDPLFIENNDENDVATDSDEDEQSEEALEEIETKPENSTIYTRSKNKSIAQSESDSQDEHEAYDFIKSILGELDINTETESTPLSEDDKKKLRNLEVKMIHIVLPQHKVERRPCSKPLTDSGRQLFLKYGPIKKGIFSPEEDKIITNNWRTFCKIHDWDPKCTEPFINLKNGTKCYIKRPEERLKFVQFLANELPWRTLVSVYQRFRKLYAKTKRHSKRYTSAEDEQILTYLRRKRIQLRKRHSSFSELSKILGRPSSSIRLRYQLLKKMQKNQNGQPLTHVKWTLTLIGKFIQRLMDVSLCEKIEDLKDAIIPKSVWLQLQAQLNIDHTVLKLFWSNQLHMQLFCRESIYMNDIKIKVIEYIYGKGISNTREIIWPNVVKYFDGVTSIFLCRIFFYLVQDAMIKIGSENLADVMEYLYNEKIEDIRNEATDKFLPRLSYNNGKVKIIDDDTNDVIK